MATPYYALSIKQPWAALLASARKSIEIRKWTTRYRGPLLIHAARVPDERDEAWKWVTDDLRPLTKLVGGIIGEGNLVGSIAYADAEAFATDGERHLNDPSWFLESKTLGLVFADLKVRPFRKIPGKVKLFSVEASLLT